MNHSNFDENRLLALIGKVLDGGLSVEDRSDLNAMLKASPEARQFYHDQMDLHARLLADYAQQDAMEFMPAKSFRRCKSRPRWHGGAALAAAACIVLAIVLFSPAGDTDSTFATLERDRGARWANSSLPTEPGSRLGVGTLRLAEGLATLRFDSGAEVTIEAPAELTLHHAMACSLRTGTVVVEVPESAIGFQVETSSARITDYGTRFSVTVDPANMETQTQVFEGMVTVRNKTSDEVATLNDGQRNLTMGSLIKPPVIGLSEPIVAIVPEPLETETGSLLIKTTKDAYIGNRTLGPDSRTLLYVKNGEFGSHRKAYLGFDLMDVAPDAMIEAELILHFAPTGLGLASHVPDATFGVYGLLNDEPWNEHSLAIGDAPANIPGSGAGLVDEKVIKLGSFVVMQGVQRGQFGITGATLTEFLRQNAGSTITLIVVRETDESGPSSLVHAFASRRHPHLPGPTLAIRLSQEP